MLPAATLAVICSRTLRSLMLSHWVDAILSACSSGVPELTRVESWWKKARVSSSLADLCGRLATRACVNHPFLERQGAPPLDFRFDRPDRSLWSSAAVLASGFAATCRSAAISSLGHSREPALPMWRSHHAQHRPGSTISPLPRLNV